LLIGLEKALNHELPFNAKHQDGRGCLGLNAKNVAQSLNRV
jgi:hypothetical protein